MKPKANVEEAIRRMGGIKPINPIGLCFDSSAYQIVFGKMKLPNLKLCHGIGIANMPGQEGRLIAHAWLECFYPPKNQRMALDTTWGVATPIEQYRRDLQIKKVISYTKEEALALWQRTDMPGPWDPEIQAVCDGKLTKEEFLKSTSAS